VVVVAPPEATAAASTAAAAAVEGPPTPPPVPGGGPAATTTLLLHADAATPPPPEASAAAAVDARALATWSGALRQRMGGPRSPLVAELCRLSLAAPALVAGALPPVLEVARLVPRRGVALGRHLVLRAALADDVKPRQRAGLATLASAQLVAVVPLPTLDALAPLDDDDEEEDGQQEGAGAGGGKAAAADRPPRAGSALHLVPYVDGAGCAQLVGFLSLPWLQEPPTSSSAGEASEEEGGRAHGPAAV
jgi:hypothetical protein